MPAMWRRGRGLLRDGGPVQWRDDMPNSDPADLRGVGGQSWDMWGQANMPRKDSRHVQTSHAADCVAHEGHSSDVACAWQEPRARLLDSQNSSSDGVAGSMDIRFSYAAQVAHALSVKWCKRVQTTH
jgi:hypothetical protein